MRIKDQQAPAAIVPADLRACQVDGTVSFRRWCIIPEKWACLGTFGENTRITIEGYLFRVYRYRCFFTRVLITQLKVIIPVVFFNYMDQAKVAATFSALTAFKRQKIDLTGYQIVHVSILMSREHIRKVLEDQD